jgi:methionine sulfoxide reductase heme-binding subunit
MTDMSGTTAFWYASRATGIVALLLLTAVLVLGLLVNRQGRLPGLPRFAVTSLHRNLSLLTVAFVAVHVVTAVLDTYVSIPISAGVIPFASGYERFWLGLGAISFDLMLAMIITSLLRGRLNRILWRAIHLLAYVSWPVALAHSIGSSRDLQHGWMLGLGVACALIVAVAIIWRLARAARQVPRAARVATAMAWHLPSYESRQARERISR